MNRVDLFKIGLKLCVSAGIITVLVLKLKPESFIETLQQITFWQLGLFVIAYLCCQVLCALKWVRLSHTMGLGGSLWLFYRYYLMGMFFNLFLPTAIGGDLGKAWLLAKEKSARWTHAFLSILAERCCGLAALLMYVLASLMVFRPGRFSAETIILLTGLWIFVLVVIFGFRWIERHPWGHRFIRRFVLKQAGETEDPGAIWPHAGPVGEALFISILFHGANIGLQYTLLTHLGGDVPWAAFTVIYGLSGLAAMIPISLNGIGLREGTTTTLLAVWVQVPAEIGAAFSLVWLSVMLLATLPGGVLSLKHPFSDVTRKTV